MFKISTKLSVTLSLVLAYLCFLLLVGLAIWLPEHMENFIKLPDLIGDRENITQLGKVIVYVLAYCIIAIALAADVMLVLLLKKVKRGLVFTEASVALIRAISWCALILGIVFAALTYFFTISALVALGGIFLGLCLRVVKNVIEEATEIKAENDFTV